MRPCPFNIGDRVTNRQIGPPVCGTVYAIGYPAIVVSTGIGSFSEWMEAYPDCLGHWAALVKWENNDSEDADMIERHPELVGLGETHGFNGRWFPEADLVPLEAILT